METQLEKLIKSGRLESLYRSMHLTLDRVEASGRDNHARIINVMDQLQELLTICADHTRQKAQEAEEAAAEKAAAEVKHDGDGN